MTECDNSKIHISSNFLLSIGLLIMLVTLLLVPSLHCNTSLHFTKLHFTTLIDISLSFTLHYPLIWLNSIYISYRSISPPITKLDTVRLSYHTNYFQNNEPLHCPKELLSISLHFTFFLLFLSTLHFTSLCYSHLQTHFPSLHFPSLFTFYRLHFPHRFTLS